MSDTEISFYKNIDIEYFFDGKVFDYLYTKYDDSDKHSKKNNTDNTAKLKQTLEENFKETLKDNKIDDDQKPKNNI